MGLKKHLILDNKSVKWLITFDFLLILHWFSLIFHAFSLIIIDFHWFSLIFIHFNRFMTIIMGANIFSNSSPAKSYKSISVILDPLNARWPRASNAPNPIAFWWLKPEKLAEKVPCPNTDNLCPIKKTSLYTSEK